MKKPSELKPCPFCGDKEPSLEYEHIDWRADEIKYFVNCVKCSAQGSISYTKEESIKAWNIRAIETELERVKGELIETTKKGVGFADMVYKLDKENAQLKARVEDKCFWKKADDMKDFYMFDTQCNKSFSRDWVDPGPMIEFKYCPYCGLEIDQ